MTRKAKNKGLGHCLIGRVKETAKEIGMFPSTPDSVVRRWMMATVWANQSELHRGINAFKTLETTPFPSFPTPLLCPLSSLLTLA